MSAQRFADRVHQLKAAGEPIRLNFGCGPQPKPGFLNIDIVRHDLHVAPGPEIFIWDYLAAPLPLADDEVDYVFHEDFIEHIAQREQVLFLAETRRVLKAGAWHRVNTPCLLASMKEHSDFRHGWAGVYQGEWINWGHISLMTRHSLEEMARMVGYREVVFNLKNQGVSPHRGNEFRPAGDRDEITGNIFADLQK